MNYTIGKIDNKNIERDRMKERSFGIADMSLYAYIPDECSLVVVGQLHAPFGIEKRVSLRLRLYDNANRLIKDEPAMGYGSTVEDVVISEEAFFDGIPFSFEMINMVDWNDVRRIEIVPNVD